MTSKHLTFYSIAETPWEGSMTALLRRAGMVLTGLNDADIIVFNGGADIGTSIYGEIPISGGIPEKQSFRDEREIAVYDMYMGKGKLMLGICRGAQLLNCLNGGSLWQDVNNHGRDHSMTVLETGHKMKITSTHHQMMRPNWEKVKLIAVSDEATQKVAEMDSYPHGSFEDDHKDTEIVYYPETHSLCIQGHPEYVPGSEFADYCVDLIKQYINEARHVQAA
jgi:gamma-glutamyl-gamma-aminobutyrate hydrolase PuuD